MSRLALLVLLALVTSTTGCGGDADTATGGGDNPFENTEAIEGQTVTVVTMTEAGTDPKMWVIVRDYPNQPEAEQQAFLELIWRQFAARFHSTRADDGNAPDPRDLPDSEAGACPPPDEGESYGFWMPPITPGQIPEIYAKLCA